MLLDKTPHNVDVSFKDICGNTWTKGDVTHIVIGNFSTYELKVDVLEIFMGAFEKVRLLG
jgi:hypothetical protein